MTNHQIINRLVLFTLLSTSFLSGCSSRVFPELRQGSGASAREGICEGNSCRAGLSASPVPRPKGWDEVQRVVVVVLENTNAKDAFSKPFLKSLAAQGGSLLNSHGITHPSQPNYIALIAGDLLGVSSNARVDLEGQHLGDLVDEKGKRWKAYAEDYPGNCFQGSSSGAYVRKHLPFISFKNVSSNPTRCSQIVSAKQWDLDLESKSLPDFSLYIPNNTNNGHDTSVEYADRWLQGRFGEFLKDSSWMKSTLFIVTFDESGSDFKNHIQTLFVGAGVRVGSSSQKYYDHYSLLATIEKIMGLGSLGRHDAQAAIIDDIW